MREQTRQRDPLAVFRKHLPPGCYGIRPFKPGELEHQIQILAEAHADGIFIKEFSIATIPIVYFIMKVRNTGNMYWNKTMQYWGSGNSELSSKFSGFNAAFKELEKILEERRGPTP